MAHACRVYTSKPVPPGAVPCKLKGKPAVKWQGRGGRTIVAALCSGDSSRCLLPSRKWYAVFRDRGRLRRVPGFEDKSATERMASDLETRAARVASGVLPPESAAGPLPLAARLDRWRDDLVNRGNTAKHAARQRRRAERVFAAAGLDRPADLTPVRVLAAVAAMRAAPHDARGFGQNSGQHYVGAVKQFCRWLHLRDRSEPADPLAGLSRRYTEPVRKRRALSPADFARLIAATHAGPVRRRLTGPERALLYRVAASTGLRAGELASLTRASFDLKNKTVTVEAAYAKNRRTDTLPLPDDLIADLAAHLKGIKPGEPVWPARDGGKGRWSVHGALMIAADLAAAGLPVRDEAGAVYDLHSLRGQLATDLERAGVSLSRAQRHMRHSSPVLTSNYYTRHDAADLRADVNKLRKPPG